MIYTTQDINNPNAYRQTAGTLFLTYHGHGKQCGHDQMSPHLYYYDDLGRRINYHAYDDRALVAKIKACKDDLKSEGLKYLKARFYAKSAAKYAALLGLKLKGE